VKEEVKRWFKEEKLVSWGKEGGTTSHPILPNLKNIFLIRNPIFKVGCDYVTGSLSEYMIAELTVMHIYLDVI